MALLLSSFCITHSNVHCIYTPSHPTPAEEAWYSPEHIQCIGYHLYTSTCTCTSQAVCWFKAYRELWFSDLACTLWHASFPTVSGALGIKLQNRCYRIGHFIIITANNQIVLQSCDCFLPWNLKRVATSFKTSINNMPIYG